MYQANVDQLIRLYSPQRGGGANDGLLYYKSNYRRQRGAGLGSIFGAIAKRLIPFAKNILWPATQKYVLPRAQEAIKGVTEDIFAGKNVAQSLKEHGKEAIKGIGSDVLTQSGSGRRRKRTRSRAAIKRKRQSISRAPKRKRQSTTKRRKSTKINLRGPLFQ